jgi:hypothetical protein
MRVVVTGKPFSYNGVFYKVGDRFGLSDEVAHRLIGRGSVIAATANVPVTSDSHSTSLDAPPKNRAVKRRRRASKTSTKGLL